MGMKKIMLAVGFIGMMVSIGFAGVIFTDDFSDNNRDGWYVDGTHTFDFSGDGMKVTPGGVVGRAIQTTFTPTTLKIGDKLTVSLGFQFASTIPDTDRAYRFGLFNSNGTSLSADTTMNAVTNSINVDNIGYFAGLSTGTSNGWSFIYNDTAASQFMSISSPAAQVGTSNFSFVKVNDKDVHEILLSIERSAASEYVITFSVDGTAYSRTHASGGEMTDMFDTFAVYYANTAPFILSDVNISMIPEPTTIGLFSVVGAGLLFIRRRTAR
jgi:hypothetical protein